MIRFLVEVNGDGEVTISDYLGRSGLYYCREGIQTHADRETEIKVWNACDELADAAREISELLGGDAR